MLYKDVFTKLLKCVRQTFWVALFFWVLLGIIGCCEASSWPEPHVTEVPIKHLGLTPQNQVQFIQGYFPGDGYIDLGTLVFTTSSNMTSPWTHLDIAVVRVPTEACPNAPPSMAEIDQTCPKSTWMDQLGIGARMGGGWWWCCNQQVIGPCPAASTPSEHQGDHSAEAYLMVNEDKMDGTLQHFDLPPVAKTTIPAPDAGYVADEEGGYFVILMANCDTVHGQAVDVNGTVRFVSLEEEVEEFIKEELTFYEWMSLPYVVLFFWFAYLMHVHKESRIRLEEWIFATLAVTMAEVLLHGLEYFLRLQTGHRNAVLALVAGITLGLKHGAFRGLLVFLCSGVGVTRSELEPLANRTLIVLVTTYIILSTALYYVSFVEEEQAASIESVYDDGFLGQLEWNLVLGMILIDIIFFVWIPKALMRTIAHLQLTNQERKLVRFRWLLRLLCGAVSFTMLLILGAVAELFFLITLTEVNDVNAFVILSLVAVLWRPNPMAREYAYVMEAPTEENDLELVESSERNTSENSESNYSSFPVEKAEAT